MQFRIYDRQTLAYKDGGYVASYTIDDDYIVNNNSTINIIKELNDKVVVGDTIVLIKTSGAYHKGTITTFDNADFKITYKADKELFNDNMLNPFVLAFTGEENKEVTIAKRFGIEDVANILESYFGKANDWLRRLPIKLVTDGAVEDIALKLTLAQREKEEKTLTLDTFNRGKFNKKIEDEKLIEELKDKIEFVYQLDTWTIKKEPIDLKDYGIGVSGIAIDGDTIKASLEPSMLWTWKNDTINVPDWLVELFTSYNVSLSWDIDFNIAQKDLSKRKPYYIVTLSAVNNSGKIIKDNVEMQTITYTERKLPEATVCIVLDSERKEIYKLNSNTNLLNPYNATENKYLSVSDYGFEEEKADKTSNISGYIPIKVTLQDNLIENGVEDTSKKCTYYTYSCYEYDNRVRYINCYDKDKQLLTYVKYNFGYDERKRFAQTLFLQDEKIKYIRICYSKNSQQLQFEEGYKKANEIEYDGFNIPAIYYLCEAKGTYYVSLNPSEKDENGLSLRVMPSKMVSATFDVNNESAEETTPQEVAEKTLIPSKFNQAIEIQISADSKMFDFENSYFGDLYKIINEHGTIDSNYTGRKEDSSSKWITLYFGLGRQNYTDLIQMRMRKNKYEVVYTK
jgi:hypothetical protein